MKGMYWRSSPKSVLHYIVLVCISISGMCLVETFPREAVAKNYELKMKASLLALQAFQKIKDVKFRSGKIADPNFDPSESGLVGVFFTPVTSNIGVLKAKQTSINPNFAALVLEYLEEAGVKKGDRIAVGLSGSFPALNISVYAAAKVLDLKLSIVSSLSSSQWGANEADFLWPDIERVLFENGIFSYRSSFLSLGGIEDRALGIPKEGLRLLESGAERNSIPLIRENSVSESLEARIRYYETFGTLKEYKAYINVGGGAISVGSGSGSGEFRPGLNTKRHYGLKSGDSVMSRFDSENVPVIHLVRVEELASENGFPLRPEKVPEPGYGKPFRKIEYNKLLTSLILAAIIGALYLLFKTESFVTEDTENVL